MLIVQLIMLGFMVTHY